MTTGTVSRIRTGRTGYWNIERSSAKTGAERGSVRMAEYIEKAKIVAVFDGLVRARERCKNCSARQTIEYNAMVYVRRILDTLPVVSEHDILSKKADEH